MPNRRLGLDERRPPDASCNNNFFSYKPIGVILRIARLVLNASRSGGPERVGKNRFSKFFRAQVFDITHFRQIKIWRRQCVLFSD
jgi:hypothetical protein